MALKVLWVDVETNGTDREDHEIWEIGAILEVNGKPVDAFRERMKLAILKQWKRLV
jgi:oligoribonuclease (3'-5' exoribonuclease)